MRRAGAEGTGIDTIVASGPNSRPILARSTFRRIEPDDLVLLTVAPRYQGYHAAIGRVVLVGDPGPEVRRALDTAIRAQRAASEALRPGREGRQVEAVGRGIVADAGLGQYFLYSGLHSVGVIEFEPPIFGPSSPATLKENMVISIDIPMFNTPWGGLRIEDGYAITAGGAEPLNRTPYRDTEVGGRTRPLGRTGRLDSVEHRAAGGPAGRSRRRSTRAWPVAQADADAPSGTGRPSSVTASSERGIST